MIQSIQLQEARMKGANLLLNVSLWLTSVGVTTRVYSCWCCSCMKAGSIGTSCLPLLHGHCMNNIYIYIDIWNTSLTSNTTTIKNESKKVLPNLLANCTPPHGNQFTQSATSHAFTFSDKPVSDCKPVFDCCWCNGKSSSRRCGYVKVGNTCTKCLLLWHGHCMNNKRSWNTYLMRNMTTINNETTNIPRNQLASLTSPNTSKFAQLSTNPAFTFSDNHQHDFRLDTITSRYPENPSDTSVSQPLQLFLLPFFF